MRTQETQGKPCVCISRFFPAGSSKINPQRNPQCKKSPGFFNPELLLLMAGPMGLEPTASGVTGRRYNRLNYDPALSLLGGAGTGSLAAAFPTEASVPSNEKQLLWGHPSRVKDFFQKNCTGPYSLKIEPVASVETDQRMSTSVVSSSLTPAFLRIQLMLRSTGPREMR